MKSSWINDLYKKNITFQGQRKIVGGYFYGITDGGVLLKIATQTFRDGSFDFIYGETPLIVPLQPGEKKQEIHIGNRNYAGMEYCRRSGYSIHEPPGARYVRLQCRGNVLSAVEECCADILRMVDSDFSKCNSVQGFAALCMERFAGLTEENRREIAANYPEDCPAEGDIFGAFGCYIYVNALLGNYAKALARIRGENTRMRLLARNSLKRGDWSQERYEAAVVSITARYREITTALLAEDTAACEAILEQNYRENRQILSKQLGFSLPESYKDLCRAE